MIIVESPYFTRLITSALSDDDYRQLQLALLANPDVGDLIQGTGGLRKLRWRMPGRGKHGGLRVIYYWGVAKDRLYLLYAYSKNAQGDLTAAQEKQLADLIRQEISDG